MGNDKTNLQGSSRYSSATRNLLPSGHRFATTDADVLRGSESCTRPVNCHAIPLTAALPKLKIPLRPTDADVLLELQPLLEAAYTNGGYADDIDSSKSPHLPLPKIVADWTNDWLKQQKVI